MRKDFDFKIGKFVIESEISIVKQSRPYKGKCPFTHDLDFCFDSLFKEINVMPDRWIMNNIHGARVVSQKLLRMKGIKRLVRNWLLKW